MNIEPTHGARETIARWLQIRFLDALNTCEMLSQVVTDFPDKSCGVQPITLKEVKSTYFIPMKLNSLVIVNSAQH